MKKRKRAAICLACILLTGLCGPSPPARAADEAASYRYTLECVGGSITSGDTVYALYVEPSRADAPPLHTGSIALATSMAEGLAVAFEADSPYTYRDFEGVAEHFDEGKATDGRPYVGFTWNVRQGKAPERDEQGRQRIALVKLGYGYVPDPSAPFGVALLPYSETESGRAQFAARNDSGAGATQVAVLDEKIRNLWRYTESPRAPQFGFYQGYYAAEAAGAPTAQFAADIGNGWQKFQIVSYDSSKTLILQLYPADGSGGWSETPVEPLIQIESGQKTPGKVTDVINFDEALQTVEAGRYKLVIEKESHVPVTYQNLVVTEQHTCPQLTGVSAYLPCGDLDGDKAVRLTDYAKLTDPARYGAAAEAARFDLDGDGRTDQADLAILIDPANYGKSEKTQTFNLEGSATP